MSHIVTIKTELRDTLAISAACQRLQLLPPQTGRFRLFSGEVQGVGVQLPNWRFPVVCDTSSGELHFDNFQGRWGDEKQLHKFVQAYAAEKVKLEVRRQGQTVAETTLADGSIKLTIHLGDAA